MGTVIQVYFKAHARSSDKFLFEMIETGFDDLGQAFEAMSRDELIVGQVLYTHAGLERNERIIHRAEPIAFRGTAVDRVDLPTWQFVREVG